MDQQLRALYSWVWDELCSGVQKSSHPFHLGILATVGEDAGQNPAGEVCSLVLREANRCSGYLLAHTDVRSNKVVRIQDNPSVSWLSYDAHSGIQVRIRATATVHTDDELAGRKWGASSLNARRCYLCYPAPGTEADMPVSGLPPRLEHGHPDAEESESGRGNFAVIRMDVREVETLEFSASGHRRAFFRLSAGELSYASWLVP